MYLSNTGKSNLLARTHLSPGVFTVAIQLSPRILPIFRRITQTLASNSATVLDVGTGRRSRTFEFPRYQLGALTNLATPA